MADSFTLQKENKDCGFFKLVDINSCVGDLPQTWNDNVISFRAQDNELRQKTLEVFADPRFTFTYLTATSATVIDRVFNIRRINNAYKSPYTLIQSLSTKWAKKEFSVYYPEFIEAITYNNNATVYQQIVLSWLNQNFPSSKYLNNQVINVFVTLNYVNEFRYVFSKIYFETCNPTNHTANTLSCNGCGGETRSGGCNVGGRCFNPYTLCRVQYTQDNQVYTCNGFVRDTFIFDNVLSSSLIPDGRSGALTIRYFKGPYSDVFVTRILKIKYKNTNGVWGVQP
jgi:hypothetical protein